MAVKKTTFKLEPTKATDNKVVFAEKLGEDPWATRRVTGLYIDKRDLRDLGYAGGDLDLTITAS